MRLELAPVCALRFAFRVDGLTLPRDDPAWVGMAQNVRAVGHEGRVSAHRLQADRILEVSAPGVYEVGFEGIGADRFQPLAPRLVEVRAGQATDVVVELLRK